MKKKGRKIILWLSMVMISFLFLYPLLWMVLTSLKTKEDVMINPFGLPVEWMFSNYADAFTTFDFPRFFLNSVVYTAGTILLTIWYFILIPLPIFPSIHSI